jgi:hypothetical protein
MPLTDIRDILQLVLLGANLVAIVGAAALFFVRQGRAAQRAEGADQNHSARLEQHSSELKELGDICKNLARIQIEQGLRLEFQGTRLTEYGDQLRRLEDRLNDRVAA